MNIFAVNDGSAAIAAAAAIKEEVLNVVQQYFSEKDVSLLS